MTALNPRHDGPLSGYGAVPATTAAWCPERLDAGRLHTAELLLELADFVTEAGGDFEMKLGGGGVHLLGQLGDQADELLAGDAAACGIRAAADGGLGGT